MLSDSSASHEINGCDVPTVLNQWVPVRKNESEIENAWAFI